MMFKKFTIIIFALVAFSLAAWDGSTIQEPTTTSIDGRQYYAIGSPEELAWFANKVNKANSGDTAISAILTADIDLNDRNWTPIGKDTTCEFDGIFDGDGHSVSGIKVSKQKYVGIFGILDLGTVKNLVLGSSEIIVDTAGRYVGGVVGLARDGSTIQNVVNQAAHISSSSYKIKDLGGIVGYAGGEIIGCVNEANVSGRGSSSVGGIVGYASGEIIGCINKGDISASGSSSEKGVSVGGIAGVAMDNLISLENMGAIYGTDCTGGIVGKGYGSSSYRLSNAVNSGDVEGKRFVGGILGCSYDHDEVYIRTSVNKGLIKGVGVSKDSLRVGGICGENCYVVSSQNYGNIEVEGTNVRNAYVGGISGFPDATMSLNVNYGDVSATIDSTLYVGGIAGFNSYSVNYCGNFGKIKGETTAKSREAHVGGIAGKISSKISNVFNQGEIHSSHYAAGITPVLPQEDLSIENFYVATDSIDAPNAAAFVYYNSVMATLQNGFADTSLLGDMPLIGENVGVAKDLFAVDTKTLQSDSLAYILDIANFSDRNYSSKWSFYYYDSTHWSRDDGYPIFADSLHNPIYKIYFLTEQECSSLSCESVTIERYSNYKGFVEALPELTDDHIWRMHENEYTTSELQNYVFSYEDYQGGNGIVLVSSRILSSSSNQSNLSSSSKKENISSSSANQLETSSSSEEQIQNMVRVKEELPNCNSRRFDVIYYVEEEDADYKCVNYKWINLSNPQAISNVNTKSMPKIFAKGRSIKIENIANQEKMVVLDVQGRVVKKALSTSSSMNVPTPIAGRYFVMVGKSIKIVDVK